MCAEMDVEMGLQKPLIRVILACMDRRDIRDWFRAAKQILVFTFHSTYVFTVYYVDLVSQPSWLCSQQCIVYCVWSIPVEFEFNTANRNIFRNKELQNTVIYSHVIPCV